ncbi:MAG TPA: hypothetical protein VLQ68_03730 [Rhizobiaceae bacterium]|nr:hypothetical protein [Rhizobiaceae bacterium]
MSRPIAERAFRTALSVRASRHLSPGRRSQAAYEAFFQSCVRSRFMRLCFAAIKPRFHCSFEEYVLYAASLVFLKRGVPLYYLPILWEGPALSTATHLGEPSIFVARHNGFGFLAKAITDLDFEVATTVASMENRSGIVARLARSGVADAGMVKMIAADRTSLLSLRKELGQGRHIASFIDRVDAGTGRADVTETGLFELARITGRPLYCMRFSVNGNGRVVGWLKGPVDCSDVSAALAIFQAFTGAAKRQAR